MILKNITGNKLITSKAQKANTFWDQLLGLLNKHNSRFLIFNTRFGIHTFFMNTAIDVILLNGNNHVIKINKYLSPNRLFLYHPKYFTVIELPKGTIDKFDIKINDKISIE